MNEMSNITFCKIHVPNAPNGLASDCPPRHRKGHRKGCKHLEIRENVYLAQS